MVRTFLWMTEIVSVRHFFWLRKKLDIGEGHPAGDIFPGCLCEYPRHAETNARWM